MYNLNSAKSFEPPMFVVLLEVFAKRQADRQTDRHTNDYCTLPPTLPHCGKGNENVPVLITI